MFSTCTCFAGKKLSRLKQPTTSLGDLVNKSQSHFETAFSLYHQNLHTNRMFVLYTNLEFYLGANYWAKLRSCCVFFAGSSTSTLKLLVVINLKT